MTSPNYIDLTVARNRPRLMAPWADAPAVAAQQRELERRFQGAVCAVCALVLACALVYGFAAKARRSLVCAGTALAADPAARVWPDAWVE